MPGQAGGFQKVEALRFQDSRQMKVIRFSALITGNLYPTPLPEELISVSG